MLQIFNFFLKKVSSSIPHVHFNTADVTTCFEFWELCVKYLAKIGIFLLNGVTSGPKLWHPSNKNYVKSKVLKTCSQLQL